MSHGITRLVGRLHAKQAEVRDRVEADDSDVLMVLDHDWCESHYYLDPNGILIELCRDTPGMPTDAARARELLTAVPEADTPQAERHVDARK